MVARNILLHKLREDSPKQSNEVKRALLKMYLKDLLAKKSEYDYTTTNAVSKEEVDQMIDIATKDLLQQPYVKEHKLPKRPLPEQKEKPLLTVIDPKAWFMKISHKNPTLKSALTEAYLEIVNMSYLAEYYKDYLAANTQEERDKIIKYWRDNKNNMWWNPEHYGIVNKSDYDPWETIVKPAYEQAKASKYYPVIKYKNKLG